MSGLVSRHASGVAIRVSRLRPAGYDAASRVTSPRFRFPLSRLRPCGLRRGRPSVSAFPPSAFPPAYFCAAGTTLIIQPIPKRSSSMPKRGDQNVLVRGMRTWPPSESALK
jgi:hypothetical protein